MDRLGELDAASQDVVIEVLRALEQQLWMVRVQLGGALMSFVSRGFHGRRRPDVDPARVPPGQYVDADFPVLVGRPDAAHAARGVDLHDRGAIDEPRRGPGASSRAAGEAITVDIHCVTKWSKLDTVWRGVVDRHAARRRRDRRRAT